MALPMDPYYAQQLYLAQQEQQMRGLQMQNAVGYLCGSNQAEQKKPEEPKPNFVLLLLED